MSIANAPPEKLIEMRDLFEDKSNEAIEELENENWKVSEKDCETLFEQLH